MIHLVTLSLFIVLVVHDAFLGGPSPFPVARHLSPGTILTLGIAPLLVLWGVTHAILWRCTRRIDRTGRHASVRTALRTLSIARIGVLVLFAGAVLGFAWLDEIRRVVGDLVLVDEAIAIAPPIAVLAGLWWSYYPIERRLREAAVLYSLDRSRPVPGLPTRFQYVLDQSRMHLLLVLVPLGALRVWWELMQRLFLWLHESPAITLSESTLMVAETVLHYAGVLLILAIMPLVLIHVWSTVRLGAGPLRDRLEDLCRANRVRVRDLLVWRTHNAMINGALIGVVPPFRYILLTDALLASLPTREVEAVMAHEVGHARRHHLPWIILILVATAGLSWTAAALAWDAFDPNPDPEAILPTSVVTAFTLLATGLMFGHVSRRFEEQADAFAVQHMTRESPDPERPGVVTEHAAAAMSGALASVAHLNHMDPEVFSYRHGSIGARRRRLHALVGRAIDALPVDRRVRRLKLAGLLALAILITLANVLP